MSSPTHSVSAFAAGFRLPLEGGRLLLRERSLWLPALVPFLLSLAAFTTAIGLVVANAGDLYEWATGWLPTLTATRWYSWVWIGPARLLLGAFGALLFLGIAGAVLVTAYLVASLVASPFHDALSQRVERVVAGDVTDLTDSGLMGIVREGGRAVVEELRRIAFFLAVTVPLALVGFVVPGAQLLTGPAIVAFTIFFLPLDYASYTLDRRHVRFAQKRRWLGDHAPVAFGFGLAAFLTCLVPGLNFVAMPLLVVAGTLLALRHAPAVAGPTPPARDAGTATSP